MCGITGIYSFKKGEIIKRNIIESMCDSIRHRGPDDYSYTIMDQIALGFRRLSIIDIENGNQPFYNHNNKIFLVCNGEIFNYRELRSELIAQGFRFRSKCDIEVLVYLFEMYGPNFLKKLNGQFAIALYDIDNDYFLLARDPLGICPLFYTVQSERIIFGSEIKAILEYPGIERQVDLTGLDQIFTLPGLVSPSTMFKNIKSLKPGHFLTNSSSGIKINQFWDLIYPYANDPVPSRPENDYIEELDDRLTNAIGLRVNADVPLGFYLSGGLDSSLICAIAQKSSKSAINSFSVAFSDFEHLEYDERSYQQLLVNKLKLNHEQIDFTWKDVEEKIKKAVFFSEAPLKETYNTCSLALSQALNDRGIKVVLSGEGADEFLGGYVGYKFDTTRQNWPITNREDLLESQLRQRLWGDSDFLYEKNFVNFSKEKRSLYSKQVNDSFETIDCLKHLEINKSQLERRDVFHKRSYLDCKLRLSDHIISDHCDRVTYANGVEGRYPFLDMDLINFFCTIPSQLKVKDLMEKYILKKMSLKYLPPEIVNRQKFSFVAPGSPSILRKKVPWIEDLLSYETIKKQGYFNPDTVESLVKTYRKEGFKLNFPFEDDLLMIVITHGLFLDVFNMPNA